MPFPIPLLPTTLIALFVIGIWMWLFNTLSSTYSKVHDIHTHLALSQITERLHEIEDANFPTTETELLTILRASKIDWNSSGIEGDQILDGWGRPITMDYDESAQTWTFRSSGKDAELGTDDDIKTTATQNQPSEQNTTDNPLPDK